MLAGIFVPAANFVPAAKFVLAGIFVPAANFLLAGIYVPAAFLLTGILDSYIFFFANLSEFCCC